MQFTKFLMLNPQNSEYPKPKITDAKLAGCFDHAAQLLETNRFEAALMDYRDIQNLASDSKELEIQAYLKYNQGICYKKLALLKESATNLSKAIEALEASYQLYDNKRNLLGAAIVQNDLGACYGALGEYIEKDHFLPKAITAYETAQKLLEKTVKIYNPNQNPQDYLRVMQNFGNTYNALAEYKEPQKNLEGAIASGEAALKVNTKELALIEGLPTVYAVIQYNMGHAFKALAEINNQEEYRNKALASCRAALQVYRVDLFPFEHAHIQNYIAGIYIDLAQISGQENYLNEAVKVSKKVLEVLTTNIRYPLGYALILFNLGLACKLYAGIRNRQEEYLSKALHYFEAILAIEGLSRSSEIFGSTYLNLGIIYQIRAGIQEPLVYLPKAVESFQDAARIYTESEYPAKYAIIQSNLGAACQALAGVDGKPDQNLELALTAFQEASRIFAADKRSFDYIQNQHKLGTVYLDMAKAGGGQERLQNAIQCFTDLLDICDSNTHPFDHAANQIGLGDCYVLTAEMEADPTGLNRAVATYETALKNYPSDLFPAEHGKILIKVGIACRSFAKVQNKEGNLTRAVNNFQTALKLCPVDKFPLEYAAINEELGYTWLEMAELNPKNNYSMAVGALETALKAFTMLSHPEKYAKIQVTLGHCHLNISRLEGTDFNLPRALKAFEAASRYYTFEQFPYEFASIMNDIGITFDTMAKTIKGVNFQNAGAYLKYVSERIFNAVGAYEAALTVFTIEAYPGDYAQVQSNLGLASSFLAGVQNKSDNVAKAIRAFEEALRVYTPEKHPVLYRQVNTQLEKEKQRV